MAGVRSTVCVFQPLTSVTRGDETSKLTMEDRTILAYETVICTNLTCPLCTENISRVTYHITIDIR
jgi:hypothetical protein